MRRSNLGNPGRAFFLSACVVLSGCSSMAVEVAPLPPEKYQKLGPTSGRACGSLILGDWVLAFIPIQLDDRVARAREQAISRVPDATDLVNVSIKEMWFYWAIGSTRCTTVFGEAIKS